MEKQKMESQTFKVETEAKKSESKIFTYETDEKKPQGTTQYIYDKETDSYKLQHQEEEQ